MTLDIEDSYTRYGPMVLRRCRQLLKQEQDAYDAAQETFIMALRHHERLSLTASSGLFYRMATNVCLNMIRTKGRRREASSDASDALIYEIACLPDHGERLADQDLLRRLFRGQKASTRQMAVMFWLEGMTYDEIAQELEMSASGVRRRLHAFKESLERQGLMQRAG